MPTGKPLLGHRRPRTDCNCNEYHRPRSSAQFCQCECHSENKMQFYQITDEVNRKYRPKFQWPLKLKDYGDESLK